MRLRMVRQRLMLPMGTGRTIDRLCVENRALQSELEQLRQALQSSPAPGRQCNTSTGLDHFVLGSMRSAEGEWKANTKSVPTPTKPCPVAASAVNGTETPSLSALSGKSTSHLGVLAPGDTSTPHGFSASALVSSSSSSRISSVHCFRSPLLRGWNQRYHQICCRKM